VERSSYEVGDLVWCLGYHGVVHRTRGSLVIAMATMGSGSSLAITADTADASGATSRLSRRYTVDVPRRRLETLAWRSTRRQHRSEDDLGLGRILVLRDGEVVLVPVDSLTDVELLRRIPREVRSGIIDSRDSFGTDEFAFSSSTLLREAAP
jgi:hypothetical protein